MSTTPGREPAIRSYFFGKGYRDLWATITDSWRRNQHSADEFFKMSPGIGTIGDLFGSCLYIASGLSTLIFGTAFLIVASTVHVVVLGLFFLLVYTGFTVLWVSERALLIARSFFVACPHCHARHPLPEYLCDGCGRSHSRLLPNSYGILAHLCQCGRRLPSTFFLNRGRLQARCPACHQSIAREYVETRRIFIPVIGGPSAGKSALLFGAVRELVEHEAASLGFEAGFLDKRSEREYRTTVGLLQSGKPPEKTRELIPRAFNLTLHRKGRLAWLLYLYDPAGEAYLDADRLIAHGFHDYLSGMIFVIDPFALAAVQSRYAAELSAEASVLRPSGLPVEHVMGRLLLTMESTFGLSMTGKIKQPLAVVLNKVDAFDLEELIGETAVDRAMEASDGTPSDRDTIRDQLLRQQLIDWGEQALVQRIETRFCKVRYFSCSALGRMADGRRLDFTARGVLPPLLWICANVHRADFAGPGKPPRRR